MRFHKHPLFWAIIGILATWRITSIIQTETIASPVRKSLGVIELEGEEPEFWIYPDNFLGKLLQCFWCGSVWVGAVVSALMLIFPPILLPFGLSAGSIAYKKLIDHEPPTYIENMWFGEEGEEEDEFGDLGEEDAEQ